MAFHLRFTPDEKVSDENLAKFVSKYEKYIVAREQHDKNGEAVKPHYHMYIESDMDIDTVRYNFKKVLSIPTGGQGRNNKYYSIKQWNVGEIGYIVKQGDIKFQAGFKMEDILQKKIEVKLKEKNTDSEAPRAEKKKEEREDEWTKLMNHCIELKDDKPTTVLGYKQVICKYYLKRLRPVPRTGDLNRYSFSLYAIFRSKYCELEDKLNVDVNEYLDDISFKQA